MDAKTRNLQFTAWLLTIVVVLVAIAGWRGGLSGNFTVYTLFPLFGLIAFSLLWAMYVTMALRIWAKVPAKALHTFFNVTSACALAAILLHPGLLEWQLWRDGFGLPPESVLQHYIAPSFAGAVVVGLICFTIFILFEARRIFQKYRWWRIMEVLTDLAVVAILYHSLQLGRNLQHGWLRYVWFFYGATLIASLIYRYFVRYKRPKRSSEYHE